MSAKKRQPEAADAAGRPKPSAAARRWPLVVGLLTLVVGGGSYFVWAQVRAHVLSRAEYQLDPAKIVLTPMPAWIHSDIKADVLRDASLAGPLSLLDDELTVRMAGAFAADPWVAHVERVSKRYPAGLEVSVIYRRPVALVEIEDGKSALPVDGEGVVLPTQDFSAADADKYPHIAEIHTTPTGPVGTRWGDPAVAGAAQVAAALADDWQSLGIVQIVPAGQKPGRSGVEYIFDLVTRGGTHVHRAPGADLPGEAPTREKLSQLKRYAAQNGGTLDQPDGAMLEIRGDGAILARPRPEVKPLPQSEE